jgi:hypothetical protein
MKKGELDCSVAEGLTKTAYVLVDSTTKGIVEKYIQHVAVKESIPSNQATGVYCFTVMLYCYAMSGIVMLYYLVAGSNTCIFL